MHNCKECVKHTDTSGVSNTPCVYCAASGECSGSEFSACLGGQWSLGCGKNALPYLNLANAALNAAKCVGHGILSTFKTLASLVAAVNKVQTATDGITIHSVCTTIVNKLQGMAQGKIKVCDTAAICSQLIVLGPEAPAACELVFVGVSVTPPRDVSLAVLTSFSSTLTPCTNACFPLRFSHSGCRFAWRLVEIHWTRATGY
jgi:hypothetical protein